MQLLLAFAAFSHVFAVAQTCTPQYGQCGGLTFTGATCCTAGLTCVEFNQFYSQCLQVTGSTSTTLTTTTTTPIKTTTSKSSTTSTKKTTATTAKKTTTTTTAKKTTTSTKSSTTTSKTTTTAKPTTTSKITVITTSNAPAATAAPAPGIGKSSSYSWNNVRIGGGGFVTGLVFSTVQKDIIYSKTDVGGCYRWDATTSTWLQLLKWVSAKDWNNQGVESIVPDPVIANRVYALLGMYTGSNSYFNGTVLRSDDQGVTWSQQTKLPFKVGSNEAGRGMGERLAVDPNNNSIVYLGARSGNGLWKSTDAGATFTRVSQFPVIGSYAKVVGDPVGIVWTVFDPTSGTSGKGSSRIFVGAAETTTNSVYVSNDGGATWKALAGQPSTFMPHRAKIVNGFLYLTYSDDCGPGTSNNGDVWKYNIATGVWKRISPVASTNMITGLSFGYHGLGIHGNTIMVATQQTWPDGQIYRSIDGGDTWSPIFVLKYPQMTYRSVWNTTALPWANLGATTVLPVPAYKIGWWMASLEIDPFNPNRFMYGTGMSVYGSNNLLNWDDPSKQITLESMVTGQEETVVFDLVAPPAGPLLVSAVGDISGFVHHSLTEPPLQNMNTPNFDTTSSVDYAGQKSQYIVRVGSGSGASHFAFSSDFGATWSAAKTEPWGAASGRVSIAADGSSVVWSFTSGVYYTTNWGTTWIACQGLPANAQITSDRVDPTRFYAVASGVAYASTNGGKSFVKTATGLPTYTSSYRPLKSVSWAAGHVWLATGDALFMSTDGSKTFTTITGVKAMNVGFGKASPTGKYVAAVYIAGTVGSQEGIYRSDDAGSTWIRINDDQHQYGVTSAAIEGDKNVYGRVFVSTGGMGVVYGTSS